MRLAEGGVGLYLGLIAKAIRSSSLKTGRGAIIDWIYISGEAACRTYGQVYNRGTSTMLWKLWEGT